MRRAESEIELRRPHDQPHPRGLASKARKPSRPSRKEIWRATRSRTSAPRCRSSRCSTWSTRAHRRGRGAHRLRLRLPRGHLRHVRPVINGKAHGPEGAHTFASCTCAASSDGEVITIEPWRAARFRSSRTSSSTAAPSTASSGRRLHLGPHRDGPRRQRRCRWRRRRRPGHGRRRLVSAAGPAWPPAPTPRPCCSSAPRSRTSASCPRVSRSGRRVVLMVDQHDAEGFGGCTNLGECAAACPKEIPQDVISTSTTT